MDKAVDAFCAMNVLQFREKMCRATVSILRKLKCEFDNRYYNTGETTIDDLKYDILVDVLKERDPHFALNIGCKLREGDNKTQLPFSLKGMDKIKKGEIDKVEEWKRKQTASSYVISDKLNGVSCLAVFRANGEVKLYTRGDGVEGSDISYLSNKIKNIPRPDTEIAVRGELIIKDALFESKYREDFKNSLSLIVSVVNSKTLKEAIADIEFLAYEIVVKEKQDLPLEKQFVLLSTMGFNTPGHLVVVDFNNESLYVHLQQRKQSSEYDLDGIIVHTNDSYNREDVNRSGNPAYAFAFKMLMEVAEATVKYVEWNPSKWGLLKPRICIEPINLCGITIHHTTGFNAGYIRDKKINKGTKLLMTRSGDIIPYIVQVLNENPLGPSLPDEECEWNDTNIDLILKNGNGRVVEIQKLIHFFVSIGVKQMNKGVISKLYDAGFNTVQKIAGISKSELISVPTIGEKMADKLIKNMKMAMTSVTLSDFVLASGIFGMGIGKKKIDMLLCRYPDIFEKPYDIDDICQIQGFSGETARKILSGVNLFSEKFESLSMYMTVCRASLPKSDQLKDKKFVFSKFRDEHLQKKIISMGGSVSESVSSKTFAVIVKNKFETSGKIDKAKLLGIHIWSKEELESFLST